MAQNQEFKRLYEVTIAGVPLKLKSGLDPEVVKRLISHVDKKIQEALPATKNGSVQNAALLAALNMAEELFELKSSAQTALDRFEKKAQKALDDLEHSTPSRMGLDN